MPEQFLSWEVLLTVPGAAALIWLIVTGLKKFLYITDRVAKPVILALSILFMLGSVFYFEGFSVDLWGNYVFAVVNGFIVALAVLRFEETTIPQLRAKNAAKKYAENKYK